MKTARITDQYLELLEESWKRGHTEAMACGLLEDELAVAVMLFGLQKDLAQRRRARVFRGLEEPNPELDAAEENLFRRWLVIAEDQMRMLQQYQHASVVVEGADRFQTALNEVRTLLAQWTPALPAMAVGSRVHDISEEDADEIRELLKAKDRGRFRWEARAVPEGDPSKLR